MPKGWSADAVPYVPLQWYYRDSPWRVCVVCQLLGMTSRRVVGPIVDGLFDRWPKPLEMAESNESELREYLRRLGMTEKRPKLLQMMSNQWVEWWGNHPTLIPARDAIEMLPGCRTYAADAVDIFCRGRTDFVPQDKVLRDYLALLKERRATKLATWPELDGNAQR